MKRVLLLTAGFGEGHNAAARGVAEALRLEDPQASVAVLDLFEMASPRSSRLARKFYLHLINHYPRCWRMLYALAEKPFARQGMILFLRREVRLLAELVSEPEDLTLCSTYPLYAHLVRELKSMQLPTAPLYTVVTDSISINQLWTMADCDGWFVPNPETAEELRRQGVAPARIHDLGFPVHPRFESKGLPLSPPPLKTGAVPRVLLVLNSGLRGGEELATLLLDSTDWELCFAVGRDKTLQRKLEERSKTRTAPTTVLGWTEDMPQLLRTHHVVVGKAGGATTQEAIAACCPLVVNQIVPGQEEGNYELLRRRKIGGFGKTPTEVVALLKRAFENKGVLCELWRNELRTLSRPSAARTIARHLLSASPHNHGKTKTQS